MSYLSPTRTGHAQRLWRFLKQATGEAKWDEYIARCRTDGVPAMSRREFERHRDEHREANPQSRCC